MDNRNTWFLAFILLALGAVALLGNSFPVILVLLGSALSGPSIRQRQLKQQCEKRVL